jgi:hypothetical protein
VRTPQLPYQLVLREVRSGPAGIDITATADEVRILA